MILALKSEITLKKILLAPGPVQLHPEVQKILGLPMIHHRTPEFDQIFKNVLENLKFLFQTSNDVFIQTSTGSGGMESLLINPLSPGDEVIAIVSGKFGERWAEMAEVFGAKVHRINCEWGQATTPEILEAALKEFPKTKIVLTQACETSTATTHPIQALGQIVAKTDALFLVDGITATGAFPTPMDAWQIDGLVAGSQKAVMLPTGASFVSFSKKAWKKIEQNSTPRYYFDIRREREANKKGESFFSAPVPLVRALDFVLGRIREIGIEAHHAHIHKRASYTRSMAEHLNLKLFSKSPSDSVTAYNLPSKNFDGVKFREHLEKKFDLTVMGGQDQLKGKIIRIGHMGYITPDDLHQTTLRIAKGLIDFSQDLDLNQIAAASSQFLDSHV